MSFSSHIAKVSDWISEGTERIVICCLGRYPLLSDLPHLQTDNRTRFILIQNEGSATQSGYKALSRFDIVLGYDVTDDEFAYLAKQTGVVDIEPIKRFVREITKCVVSSRKLRLVCFDDFLLGACARLRKELGIPGQKPEEFQKLSSLVTVKEFASTSGLPTTDYFKVQMPEEAENYELILCKAENLIQFPLFLKADTGDYGTVRIGSERHLLEWFKNCNYVLKRQAVRESFILEKQLENFEELTIFMLIDDKGKANVIGAEFYAAGDSIRRMGEYCSVKNAEIRFPGLSHFSAQIVDVFLLTEGGAFTVSCFYERTTAKFFLKRLSTGPLNYVKNRMLAQVVGADFEAQLILVNCA